MDAALARDKNDSSVVIVQLYGKIIMKTNCLNHFSSAASCDAGTTTFRWAIVKGKPPGKTLKCYARRWFRRHELRNALVNMDEQAVEKDIGVPRGTLRKEAYKPFWQK